MISEIKIWAAGIHPVNNHLQQFGQGTCAEQAFYADCINFAYILLKGDIVVTGKISVSLYLTKTKYIGMPQMWVALETDQGSTLSVLKKITGGYVSADPFLLCDPVGCDYSLVAECKKVFSKQVLYSSHRALSLKSEGKYVLNFMMHFTALEASKCSFCVKIYNANNITFRLLLSRDDANGEMVEKLFPFVTSDQSELETDEVSLPDNYVCKFIVSAIYDKPSDADNLIVTFKN